MITGAHRIPGPTLENSLDKIMPAAMNLREATNTLLKALDAPEILALTEGKRDKDAHPLRERIKTILTIYNDHGTRKIPGQHTINGTPEYITVQHVRNVMLALRDIMGRALGEAPGMEKQEVPQDKRELYERTRDLTTRIVALSIIQTAPPSSSRGN